MNSQITIILDTQKKEMIAAIARLDGLNLSAWIRSTILKAAESSPNASEASRMALKTRLEDSKKHKCSHCGKEELGRWDPKRKYCGRTCRHYAYLARKSPIVITPY